MREKVKRKGSKERRLGEREGRKEKAEIRNNFV